MLVEDHLLVQKVSEWPMVDDHEHFINGESGPTLWSITQVTPAVTEVHYNSFNKVEAVTNYFTDQLKTTALVNMYQSTAEYCFWAYHQTGETIRWIEVAEGEVLASFGALLGFEGQSLGHDIGGDGDSFFVYDSGDMDSYNEAMGFEIEVYQDAGSTWQNFSTSATMSSHEPKSPIQTPTSQDKPSARKPWWRFW